ncbi:hypothetical protein DPMN_176699 [Dreissena polymorpha]|uniref:Uncharacterized protein n=1 Tax=Dreissena polymorpha TaxID=45954 RepID=A0A9D4E8V5_DREPO|nr:hypothetical protein DPMN_176699 [Dreissena polymorpha]
MVLSSLRKHSEQTSRQDAHQTSLPAGYDRRSGTHTQHTSLSHCESPASGCNGSTLKTRRNHFKHAMNSVSDQRDESAERLVPPEHSCRGTSRTPCVVTGFNVRRVSSKQK